MLFADDSYVYCKAESEEARKVLKLLSIYEKASGQRVNRGGELCQVLQIPEADNFSKYMGLPNLLGRNKTAIFGYLKDKVNVSIHSWNEKKVSKSTKEILIKTVAQTLPYYAMNVFLLQLELVRDMEKIMAKFFWNTSQKNNSKITWIACEIMSRHKHAGGLGFKSLRDVNLSMLGKQC
ncbi:uncharacterized protein LOC141663849 [Apium graveolens]|uniref:uncharacterized protein LOC141663849 n=1 Tax=Apium graveolens TaxID=4045 RepID=UPI003D79F5C6